MHLTMVFNQLTNNLKLIVWTNIKVGLHSLDHRLLKVLRVNLKHDLEWESLQDC